MWQRLKPAFSLVLLAPLIAEYLLGSLSFGQLALFPIMALMYGAGALLVRELARRAGLGWRGILLLGLAYAFVEEGLATQSLFNPHYLGLRLLDYGYLPALGIGAPWTAYVLVLHVAWSIAVPVAFVEALFPDRRETPWLGRTGLIVAGVVYGLGVALVAFGSWKQEHFAASPAQLASVAVLAAVVTGVAFRRRAVAASAPGESAAGANPGRMGLLAFSLGSLFHLLVQFSSGHLPAVLATGLTLALPLGLIVVVTRVRRSGGWTPAHTDALMLGGLLAYCWLGFLLVARLHGASAVPGQLFPCAIVLGLVWLGWVRRKRGSSRAG